MIIYFYILLMWNNRLVQWLSVLQCFLYEAFSGTGASVCELSSKLKKNMYKLGWIIWLLLIFIILVVFVIYISVNWVCIRYFIYIINIDL